jgi:KaiC/GvpD/RAD55 family RecA-like ATPase
VSEQPFDFVRNCGGWSKAVALVVTASRFLWESAASLPSDNEGASKRTQYRRFVLEDLSSQCIGALPDITHTSVVSLVWLMAEKELCSNERIVTNLDAIHNIDKRTEFTYKLSAHNPLGLSRKLLDGIRPDHDLRYAVWRNIRRHYDFVLSADIAFQIHTLAFALNELIASRRNRTNTPRELAKSANWNLKDDILPALFKKRTAGFSIPPKAIDLFLESCRAVNYLSQSYQVGDLLIRASEIDPEFLLSQLFGFPTSIRGLDDLFGGGGLMLPEALDSTQRPQLGGRVVLSMGPFGSGKSLLALKMAAEVARKGGVAWFMPLEQSAEECLYSLGTMGCLGEPDLMKVATTVPEAIEALEDVSPHREKGCLVLLRTVKESFNDFASALEENARLMSRYSLRLLIVDPVNAVSRMDANVDLRNKLASLFEVVKSAGVNVWLVAEQSDASTASLEQSVSDTVLRLDSYRLHGYTQRFLEITKSRLQRENRGLHPFDIGPGGVITVYPSSATFRSKLNKRNTTIPEHPIKFGVPTIDSLLQSGNLFSGDVIALEGPSGTGKSSAALKFLLSPDRIRAGATLLVTNIEAIESLRFQLNLIANEQRVGAEFACTPDDVKILGLSGGYIQPGSILQTLESELDDARIHRKPVVRVVLDNVVNLELGCPFISADQTFGDTLVDLLRKHGVTSVFVCREALGRDGACLQQTILNNADCLIEFSIKDSRSYIEVKKSRGTHHKRGVEPIDDISQTLSQ